GPYRRLITRLVTLCMPASCTIFSGTVCASTSQPHDSSSDLTTSACGVLFPGGVSDGVWTSFCKKAVCSSKWRVIQSLTASSCGSISPPASGFALAGGAFANQHNNKDQRKHHHDGGRRSAVQKEAGIDADKAGQ